MKVYLVRHGQVNSNFNKVYNNVLEDINENGIKQAMELKEIISEIDYDVVYSSPLIRAKHTSEIINVKQKEVIFDDRLEERNPGDLLGKPYEVTNREEYWNYYSTVRYGTEESIQSLFDRVWSFLDELSRKDYDKVLIVAHSGVSKAFFAYFNGIPDDGKFLNLGLKNCEVKEYEFL